MKFDDRLANKVIKKEEFEQQQQKLRKNMMWKRRELSG